MQTFPTYVSYCNNNYAGTRWRNERQEMLVTSQLVALQVPQVLHGHLQYICLLQFGVSGTLQGGRQRQGLVLDAQSGGKSQREARGCSHVFLEGVQDEGLQLTQTLIDPSTSAFFHDWFGRLEGKKNKKKSKYCPSCNISGRFLL